MMKKKNKRLLELIKSSFELFDENGQLMNKFSENFDHKLILMTNILRDLEIFGLNCKLERLKFRTTETFYYGWGKEVFKNLQENYNIESITLENFFHELNKFLNSIEKKDLENYDIILPINLTFQDNLPQKLYNHSKNLQISLENYKFFSKNYSRKFFNYIEQNYDKYIHKNVLNLLHNIRYENCSYIVIKLNARDKIYIKEVISRNIDLNLGIFCFIKVSLREVMRYSLDDFINQNLTENNSPLMIVVKNDDIESVFFSTFKNFEFFESFNTEELNSYKIIIKLIKNIKNQSIRFLIDEAFRVYYLALTNTVISDSFIKFWNVIEILFLKKAGITEERIKKRLKSLFKPLFKRDFDEMIELIYSKRNFLVHEAKDIITEADRYFIKELSEHSINFFLEITQKIQDIGMLEFLYDNMNNPEKKLIKKINILKDIKNLKFP
ncbi:MAG: hypothetical protein ACFFG0_06160 [Candidatus Thorarchaeota archaeon]